MLNGYLLLRNIALLIIIFLCSLCTYGENLDAHLVHDINRRGFGLEPSAIGVLNNLLVVPSNSVAHNGEIWVTDGTADGFSLIYDMSSISNPDFFVQGPTKFTEFKGALYFVGYSDDAGYELWKTDGTVTGTGLVKDIYPGVEGSFPTNLMVFNDTLYFIATDNLNGQNLWKTDSTLEGTSPVTTLVSARIPSLVNAGDKLIFSASDVNSLYQPWQSDGTTEGTFQITTVGSGGIFPSDMFYADGYVYFAGDTDTEGYELWRTDGTFDGTTRVKDIAAGIDSSYPSSFSQCGDNKICFEACVDSSPGCEPWVTNGTESGTLPLSTPPSTINSDPDVLLTPSYFAAGGSNLYFNATDGVGVSGYELWKTDGTPEGTQSVSEVLNPGSASSYPYEITYYNNQVYFAARTPATGYELWLTDGTPDSTRLFRDIAPDSLDGSPHLFTPVNGFLYFAANDSITGDELWKTDGTYAGTNLISNFSTTTYDSFPNQGVAVGEEYYFTSDDGVHGREIWRTDGTNPGTSLLLDILSGPNSSSPDFLSALEDKLLFTAIDPGTGTTGVWISDGTPDGTKPLIPGKTTGSIFGFTAVETKAFFSASAPDSGRELWVTDGTTEGTSIIDIVPGPASSSPGNLVAVGATLFFTANGAQLWKSNGTSFGTVLVKDFGQGNTSRAPELLTNVSGKLYFTADDGTLGRELWTSDGTESGTKLLKDITAETGSTTFFAIEPFGSKFLISLATGKIPIPALWVSDGTDIGTTPLPLFNITTISEIATLGDTAFFITNTNNLGLELWKTDGNVNGLGTQIVKDIVPGLIGSSPHELVTSNSAVYFIATDIDGLMQVWLSDGTEDGTTPVNGENNSTYSNPSGLSPSPSGIFFSAIDLEAGNELFFVPFIDLCPEDPAKTDPGFCGCGNPETDSDHDFTPDCKDDCPDDPKKIDPGICLCGNPETDGDGDGEIDCNPITGTPIPTPTITPTPKFTPTPSPTFQVTPTITPVATVTPLQTATPTFTATPVFTATPTSTPSEISSPTPTFTPTPVFTPTPIPSISGTPGPTATPNPTPVKTPTPFILKAPKVKLLGSTLSVIMEKVPKASYVVTLTQKREKTIKKVSRRNKVIFRKIRGRGTVVYQLRFNTPTGLILSPKSEEARFSTIKKRR